MCRCCYIITVTFDTSVFSGQVFRAYIHRFSFNDCTCRPTVTGIVFAYLYIGIEAGYGHSTSFPFYKRTAYRQPVEWMNHQAAYNILLVVFIFQVDTLPIHYRKIIVHQFSKQITIDQESHITSATGTIQRITAIDASQIIDRLRVAINQFHIARRHWVFNGIHGFELSDAGSQLREEFIFGICFKDFSSIGKAVHEVAQPTVGNFTLCHEDNPLDVERITAAISIIVSITHLCITGEADTIFERIYYVVQTCILCCCYQCGK